MKIISLIDWDDAMMRNISYFVLCLIFTSSTYFAAGQEKDATASGDTENKAANPCSSAKCTDGQQCVVKDGKGVCECIEECPNEWNDYPRSLCTVEGITFRHECELWRSKCVCEKDASKCPEIDGKKPTQFVIQYYDECRDLKSLCDWDREKPSFALRMSMWFRDLFSVKWSVPPGSESDDDTLLRPMSSQTRDKASKLLSLQTGNVSLVPGQMLSYWFCELDRDNSNSLDSNEITRLTHLLSPSTPCLDEFLTSCGGKTVSADQWHKCLNVAKDEQAACSTF
jgi:secreted protein acidic and rich in cysteine